MPNKPNSNDSLAPLVLLLSKKFFFIIFLVIYFGFSILNNFNFSPSKWNLYLLFSYVFINLLVILGFLVILDKFKVINPDVWLTNITNPEAYSGMTKFDAILAHYTNVATVGLFIGVLIYTGRQVFSDHPRFFIFIAVVLIFLIFFLYSLLFTRLVFRLSKGTKDSKLRYLLLIFSILIVDSLAIGMFIDAVPEAKEEVENNVANKPL